MPACGAWTLSHRWAWQVRLLAGAAVYALTACSGAPTDVPPDQPRSPTELPAFAQAAVVLRVDAQTGAVTRVVPTAARPSPNVHGVPASITTGPSFALLGRNEVNVTLANFRRSGRGQFAPGQVRFYYDATIQNLRQGVALTPPTFPTPPNGNQGLMLIPYAISNVVGLGTVTPSVDWNGAPRSFFNDALCFPLPGSDCYRWEGFAAPLKAGATSESRAIGFDVGALVQSFDVYFVLAADVADDLPSKKGTIVFTSLRSGTFNLWTMNPDGSNQLALTTGAGADFDPDWSPDYTRVVFERNNQIWIVSLANGTEQQIGSGHTPDWSPDGSKIAFAASTPQGPNIFVMNPDGTGVTQLTFALAADLGPAWSPDGQRIAFFRDTDGNSAQVWVMDADGGNAHNVSNSLPQRDYAPAWSPDGTRLAFSRMPPIGNNTWDPHVYLMNPDGTGQTNIAAGDQPAWSPDGTRIAFVVYDAPEHPEHHEIYTMAPDGTDQTQLTTASGNSPAWR